MSDLVCGIDPGLAYTGWGILRKAGNKFVIIDSGQIVTKSQTPLEIRLLELYEALGEFMNKYSPSLVGIEKTLVNKSAHSSIDLASGKTIAVLKCAQIGCQLITLAPTTIKKCITGSGRATKEQMAKMLGFYLDIEDRVLSSHQVDAICIGICAAQHNKTYGILM